MALNENLKMKVDITNLCAGSLEEPDAGKLVTIGVLNDLAQDVQEKINDLIQDDDDELDSIDDIVNAINGIKSDITDLERDKVNLDDYTSFKQEYNQLEADVQTLQNNAANTDKTLESLISADVTINTSIGQLQTDLSDVKNNYATKEELEDHADAASDIYALKTELNATTDSLNTLANRVNAWQDTNTTYSLAQDGDKVSLIDDENNECGSFTDTNTTYDLILNGNKLQLQGSDGTTNEVTLPEGGGSGGGGSADEVISKGDGNQSVEIAGGSAVTDYAIAMGHSATAGSFGWRISHYTKDSTDMVIDDPNETFPLDAGYAFSVRFNSNYDLYGTIVSASRSDNKVSIQISKAINDVLSNDNTDDRNTIKLYSGFTSDIKTDKNNLVCIQGGNIPVGVNAVAQGDNTQALGLTSSAEGKETKAIGAYAHTEGRSTIAAWGSHAEGQYTRAVALSSHAEGQFTQAKGQSAHAEGIDSIAEGNGSHAEGSSTKAVGAHSHVEGHGSIAYGWAAHAEGSSSIASNEGAHAEGHGTIANANGAHAEGTYMQPPSKGTGNLPEKSIQLSNGKTFTYWLNGKSYTTIKGPVAEHRGAHAEGSQTLAYAYASHAEGRGTVAEGEQSHAGGLETIAVRDNSTAIGQYNLPLENGLFIIGNGEEGERKNAFVVYEDGHAEASSCTGNNGDNEVVTMGYLKNYLLDKEW